MSKFFFTHTDTELEVRNGSTVTVLEPVPPDSYDFEDVGPMSLVRFDDGTVVQAFDDEIVDTIWVAGWNLPGYLPETEPVGFASWDDAWQHLWETIDRWRDQAEHDLELHAPEVPACPLGHGPMTLIVESSVEPGGHYACINKADWSCGEHLFVLADFNGEGCEPCEFETDLAHLAAIKRDTEGYPFNMIHADHKLILWVARAES